MECQCDVICLQETKRDSFDLPFIRKLYPPAFDAFEFLPSVGASGGIITIWKSSMMDGTLSFQNKFAFSVDFTSLHNNYDWILTNVYCPCSNEGNVEFTDWLKSIQMPDEVDWLILGDFNLMRSSEDRNKPGGYL